MGMYVPDDKSCVNYRFIVNDCNVWPWEPLPEAGCTLRELVDYLKQCSHTCDRLGSRWDYRRLTLWSGNLVAYGARGQFWIPVPPQQADFAFRSQENLPVTVTCCGRQLEAVEAWDSSAVCPDIGYVISCDICGRHTNSVTGFAARSPEEAVQRWMTWYTVLQAKAPSEVPQFICRDGEWLRDGHPTESCLIQLTSYRRTTVPREIAEEAHKEYVRLYGSEQSLERINARGGFAATELAILLYRRLIRKG